MLAGSLPVDAVATQLGDGVSGVSVETETPAYGDEAAPEVGAADVSEAGEAEAPEIGEGDEDDEAAPGIGEAEVPEIGEDDETVPENGEPEGEITDPEGDPVETADVVPPKPKVYWYDYTPCDEAGLKYLRYENVALDDDGMAIPGTGVVSSTEIRGKAFVSLFGIQYDDERFNLLSVTQDGQELEPQREHWKESPGDTENKASGPEFYALRDLNESDSVVKVNLQIKPDYDKPQLVLKNLYGEDGVKLITSAKYALRKDAAESEWKSFTDKDTYLETEVFDELTTIYVKLETVDGIRTNEIVKVIPDLSRTAKIFLRSDLVLTRSRM